MSMKSPLRSVPPSSIQVASQPKQPLAFDPTIYATKNLPADDVARLK